MDMRDKGYLMEEIGDGMVDGEVLCHFLRAVVSFRREMSMMST